MFHYVVLRAQSAVIWIDLGLSPSQEVAENLTDNRGKLSLKEPGFLTAQIDCNGSLSGRSVPMATLSDQ